jgi:plasmid stabilization system protein ParE
MTLRFTPRARDDLREILEYIAKESPAAADPCAERFSMPPHSSRPHLGIRNAKAPELRSRLVPRYPYRIHYLVEDADVWIIHIRHPARRPWNTNAPPR